MMPLVVRRLIFFVVIAVVLATATSAPKGNSTAAKPTTPKSSPPSTAAIEGNLHNLSPVTAECLIAGFVFVLVLYIGVSCMLGLDTPTKWGEEVKID